MDPTAPNDPNNPNPASPPNPIQPGQFVVAGEDAAPASAPQQQANAAPAQPAVSLAGQRQESAPVFPNAPVSGASTQPDPTPYMPPTGSPNGATPPPLPAESKGKGSKLIIMVLAVIVLISIIGAVLWFFVLPKTKTAATKTEDTSTQVQEEPSAPPQRTEGGFGQIPESTAPAQVDPPPTTQTTIPTAPTTQNP